MVPARWQPFVQLILARVREFYREPHVIFWVYGFPLILAVALGIAFWGRDPIPPTVDVAAGPGADALARELKESKFDVEVHDVDKCKKRLKQGKTDLYLRIISDGAEHPSRLEYHWDSTRKESVPARYWVEAAFLRSRVPTEQRGEDVKVREPGSRYIDFLLPGLIGMNVMGGGLFGVGFVLVDMRVRKLFKRLIATPMRHSDFLLAMLTARLLFLIPEVAVLLLFGHFVFDVPIDGSVATLLVVILMGAAAFAGLGLLLGCRAEKLETISGTVNAVMLPSYLFCGIFFSSRRFPESAQPFIQALPLTQLNDALRAVMLEEAGFAEIWWRLLILAVWAAVCFTLALRWFRWR
jgi:ABC-2 type transport system permease protein